MIRLNKQLVLTTSLISLLILSLSWLPLGLLAQEADVSPSPESESTESADPIQQSIRERIEQALTEIESSLGGIKAFVGEVESITSQSLELTTGNTTYMASLSEETALTDDQREPIELTDLIIGEYAIVVGVLDEDNGTISAYQILSLDESPYLYQTESTIGRVTQLELTTQTLTLNSIPDNDLITLQLNNNSTLAEQGESLSLSDINLGDTMVLIYEITEESDNIINLASRVATGSAEPTDAAE